VLISTRQNYNKAWCGQAVGEQDTRNTRPIPALVTKDRA